MLLKETVARDAKAVRELLAYLSQHHAQPAPLCLEPLDLTTVGVPLHRGVYPGPHRVRGQRFSPLCREHLGRRPTIGGRRVRPVVQQNLDPLAHPFKRALVARGVQIRPGKSRRGPLDDTRQRRVKTRVQFPFLGAWHGSQLPPLSPDRGHLRGQLLG